MDTALPRGAACQRGEAVNPAKVHDSLGGGGPLGVSLLLRGLSGDRASSQPVPAQVELQHCPLPHPPMPALRARDFPNTLLLPIAGSTFENSVQPA